MDPRKSSNIQDAVRDEILDYLPLYPNISKNVGYDLFKFGDLKRFVLDPNVPSVSSKEAGTPLPHQELSMNLFSPKTPYNSCLFWHEPGVGKTCLVAFIIENYRRVMEEERNGRFVKPALILVPNDAIESNFITDIAETCTRKIYNVSFSDFKQKKKEDIISRKKRASKFMERKLARIKKKLEKTYEIHHHEKFLNNIYAKITGDDPYTRNNIISSYSDRYIVIDEAHNIKKQHTSNKKNDSVYDKCHRFLHSLKNVSVFLLSATPMRDDVSEIAGLLNLINKKQLEEGATFVKKYFTFNGNIKEDMISHLKEHMYGRISYLRATSNNAKKYVIGSKIPDDKEIMYYDVMTEQQTKLLKVHKEIAAIGTHKLEIDLSNFAFVDGIDNIHFCKDCYKNNGICIDFFQNHIVYDENAKRYRYKDSGMPSYIKNNLEFISPKFKAIVENILQNKNELVYIYNELVEKSHKEHGGGGGVINMGLVIEAHGLEMITQPMLSNKNNALKKNDRVRRFMIYSGSQGSIRDLNKRRKMIDKKTGYFNIKENRYGGYCQVIIGSSSISEGLNLYNVRQMHIVNGHWNKAGTEQAEGRAYRHKSHEGLDEKDRYLKVFRHASVFRSDNNRGIVVENTFIKERLADFKANVVYGYPQEARFSDSHDAIDLRIYRANYDKNHQMMAIKRIAKEAAIDCIFLYGRNVLEDDIDGSLECEERECNYQCDGTTDQNIVRNLGRVWRYILGNDKPNNGSIIEKYDNDNIIRILLDKFSRVDSMTLHDIVEYINQMPNKMGPYSIESVTKMLRHIIGTHTRITNRYGAKCYLQETNNHYFLSYDFSVSNINIFNADSGLMATKYSATLSDLIEEDVLKRELNSKTFAGELCAQSSPEEIVKQFINLFPSLKTRAIEICVSIDNSTSIIKKAGIWDVHGQNGQFYHKLNTKINSEQIQQYKGNLYRKYMRDNNIVHFSKDSHDSVQVLDKPTKQSTNEIEKMKGLITEYAETNQIDNPLPEIDAMIKDKTSSTMRVYDQGKWRHALDKAEEMQYEIPDVTIAKKDENILLGFLNSKGEFKVKRPERLLQKKEIATDKKKTITGKVCKSHSFQELYVLLFVLPDALNSLLNNINDKDINDVFTGRKVAFDNMMVQGKYEKFLNDEIKKDEDKYKKLVYVSNQQKVYEKNLICTHIQNALLS